MCTDTDPTLACSNLQNDEFLRLTMNAIHMDLTSRNEAFETLGLSFIGNGALVHAAHRCVGPSHRCDLCVC